jgi:hypothetical protein
MRVGSDSVKLVRAKLDMKPSDYALIAHTEENQKLIKAEYDEKFSDERAKDLNIGETTWEAPRGYKGGHYDHFDNFFKGVRGEKKIVEDPTFGLRAAGAALLANESYFKGEPVRWDPEAMKLI